MSDSSRNYKKPTIIGIIVFLVILLFIILNPFVVINSDEKGLLFTFGSISSKVLDSGLSMKTPFIQHIEKVTIRPIQIDYKVEVGKDGAITKDNQTIGADVVIFFKFKPEQLVSMWKNYGEEKIKSILLSTIKESFKSVVGGYDIFTLPTAQEEIRKKIVEIISSKLVNYPIDITEVKITNYDWSDEFDKQIQETMKKAQEVKQKEQELQITQLESQKLIKQAESEKQALINKSEGERQAIINQAEAEKQKIKLESEAKILQGDAIRKYNESLRASVDIEIQLRKLEIEKIKAEKWNGAYVANNNYLPIPFNYGSVLGESK